MKNKLMAAIGVLLVSVSCIASSACLCQAQDFTFSAEKEAHFGQITVEADNQQYTFNNVDDFHIACNGSLTHVDPDTVVIGENEDTYVTLNVTPANRTDKDFLFTYDGTVISPELVSIENDEKANETNITIKINKEQPGATDFTVCSGYDNFTKGAEGANIKYCALSFINLTPEDGQVVYASNADKTYTFDEKAAGKDAVATTLYDAKLGGLQEK